MIMKQEQTKWIELLNKGVKMWQLPEYDKPRGIKIVGVISDYHAPNHNPRAFQFLIDTFVQRGVTDIVIIGDFIDCYWQSKKYLKNYNVMGPTETKNVTQKIIDVFAREFPVLKYLWGNHEQRITTKVTDDFVEDNEEALRSMYNIPDTWEIGQQFIIDDVCYVHGTGVSGQNGALAMLRTKRMSVVMGHTHSFGGVQYSNNGIETNFALNVGCLVDLNSPVFSYGVNSREKPVLGCGIVYNRSYAEFVPML